MSGPPPDSDNPRISLEPHLVELLRPLVDAVPTPLSAELSPLLSEQASSPTLTISYALLRSISKWARTEEGASTLKSKVPPLDPLSYNMVPLLAGTRTSPDKKFPQLPQPSTRSEIAARDISDRRAILAVLNALLSVICTGAAVWWAAQRTGWRDEWVSATYVSVGVKGSARTRRVVSDSLLLEIIKFIHSFSRKFSCRCSPRRPSPYLRLDCTSFGNPAGRGRRRRPSPTILRATPHRAMSVRRPPQLPIPCPWVIRLPMSRPKGAPPSIPISPALGLLFGSAGGAPPADHAPNNMLPKSFHVRLMSAMSGPLLYGSGRS